MFQIKINSTTGSEIVSTADVKLYSRIDTTADDNLIADMIKQARIWCENYIGQDIVAKNRTVYLGALDRRFSLPFPPIASVSSVTVDGTSATYKTYGLDDLEVGLNELPAKEVKITYVTAGQDDELLKQAILQLVNTYYDNRSDFNVMQGVSFVEVPSNVKSILDSYKKVFI